MTINKKKIMPKKSSLPKEIVIYKSKDGGVNLDVELKNETIWLSQAQISVLFGVERSVITKHLRNIFQTGELKTKSVCAFFAHC